MNTLRRLLLTALLVAAPLPSASGQEAPAPARPTVSAEMRTVTLDARAAEGISGLPKCKEAIAALPEKPEKPGGKTWRGPLPKPDPTGMPELVVMDPTQLPGYQAAALPAQPIEGPPEVLARIRDVFARGARGERVRLSFYGASHTGGEYWTGRIRRVLQARWGDLGHGYVLPAALYKGHRATDVNLCRTDGWMSDWKGKANAWEDGLLGFAGMSAGSSNPNDFGWVETTHTNKRGRKVDQLDVYALVQPGGGTLLVQVDALAPFEVTTAGDEHRLLRLRVDVADGGHRLKLSPAGDGEVRIFGVSMERRGGGALVDSMGIRGREARDWLEWEPTLFAQGLRALSPDLVVLAYGTNEAADQRYTMDEYRADLAAVLTKLRTGVDGDVPCILAGPSDRGWKHGDGRFAIWDRTEPVARVQREVAAQHGCAFWDWQQAMGGPGSMIGWYHADPKLGAGDLIHHTRAGYEFIADRFIDAIDAIEQVPYSPGQGEGPIQRPPKTPM